jgi:methyl-accepting chemotaxis protein
MEIRKYTKQIALTQGFGLSMGVIFPLFAGLFVEYKPEIPNAFYYFWAGCLAAGSIVGWVCFYIGYKPQKELEAKNEELFNKVLEFEAMKMERDVLVEHIEEKG